MKTLFSCIVIIFLISSLACFGRPEDIPGIPQATETPSPSKIRIPVSPTIGLSSVGAFTEQTQFNDAPDRDLFQLTKELVPGHEDFLTAITIGTPEYQVGRIDTFWLVDLAETEIYQSEFELIHITPHAYWYVEKGLDVSLTGIKRSASVFEEKIYPDVTRVFGSEWTPGIDNDSRLTILNAQLNGMAGYYSSTDQYPNTIRSKSNQREMIYINAKNVPPGGTNYEQVLAHELQHAIHWNMDPSEDTWVNEGLSELSSSIALNSRYSIQQFLESSKVSLTNWPTSIGSLTNYGASSLFMHFLSEHYGGHNGIRALVAEPKDSISGINAYLENMGYDARFDDVFREWTAANYIDGHGILGYQKLKVRAAISDLIRGFGRYHSTLPQYAVEYTELLPPSAPFTLTFKGSTTTSLLPIDIGDSGCWWSNSGDSIDSTLTHHVHLSNGTIPTLDYEIWFQIEENWDYVYVEVSDDDRQTWQIMETPTTSLDNFIGSSFGPGYTGNSDGWVGESIDLSDYVEEKIWIRFQYVTDDAVNGIGACIRNISIGGATIGRDYHDWEANGFIFTNNIARQRFQVQLITNGYEPQVRQILLDADNAADMTLDVPAQGQRFIIAVGALAEKTREPASYTLMVNPAK